MSGRARKAPDEIDPAALPGDAPQGNLADGGWLAPLELVLAAPTSSVIQAAVRRRIDNQDWPYPNARVFKRGKRFFAEVFFHGARRPSVLFPLDVWAVDTGLAAENGL